MHVLLLHGLGATRAQPSDLFGPLFGPSDVVVAPDVRAHGESQLVGGPGDFTFDALAREAVTGLPLDEAWTVIGISMGAALALRVATTRLLTVSRLVLVRPAFTDVPFDDHLAALTVTGDLLGRYPAEDAARRFALTPEARAVRAVSARSADAMLDNFRAPLAVERRVRFTAVPRNTSLDDPGIARLDAPTLVVGTDADPIHPLRVAHAWRDAIPGARIAVSANRNSLPETFDASFRRILADELRDTEG